MQNISYSDVLKIWVDNETLNTRAADILKLAQQKGFASIAEWRSDIAVRLGMDRQKWSLQEIADPSTTLPSIIIGPYPGWSKFIDNHLHTSFAQALKTSPQFREWCSTHDRIIPLAKDFPKSTTLILYQAHDGRLIHLEGGHRICTVAYQKVIGRPIVFTGRSVYAAVATITDADLEMLHKLLWKGTNKQS